MKQTETARVVESIVALTYEQYERQDCREDHAAQAWFQAEANAEALR